MGEHGSTANAGREEEETVFNQRSDTISKGTSVPGNSLGNARGEHSLSIP